MDLPAAGPALTADDQAARVFAWRRGFNATWLIDLGIKLKLFADLAAHPASTPASIAERLGLQRRHVEIWCQTAYAFELLDAATDGVFSLAPFMDQVLGSPGHPRYVGGYVQLGTDYATDDFRALRDAFVTGEGKPFQGRDDQFSSHVADATYGLQWLSARKLLPEMPAVKAALDAGGALLEVGPGSARQLLMLAKVFPHARLVGVDIDPVGVRIARETVARAGLTERISILEGSVEDATAAGPFAAVVMVEVLHEIRQDLRAGVVAACGKVLMPGGWLLVIDETYPETLGEFRAPEARFAVQTGFEELHWGNVIPTRSEQLALLSAAGFAPPDISVMGEGFTIIRAQRPAAAPGL
jgi:SAM-dependent methyltransferase